MEVQLTLIFIFRLYLFPHLSQKQTLYHCVWVELYKIGYSSKVQSVGHPKELQPHVLEEFKSITKRVLYL